MRWPPTSAPAHHTPDSRHAGGMPAQEQQQQQPLLASGHHACTARLVGKHSHLQGICQALGPPRQVPSQLACCSTRAHPFRSAALMLIRRCKPAHKRRQPANTRGASAGAVPALPACPRRTTARPDGPSQRRGAGGLIQPGQHMHARPLTRRSKSAGRSASRLCATRPPMECVTRWHRLPPLAACIASRRATSPSRCAALLCRKSYPRPHRVCGH